MALIIGEEMILPVWNFSEIKRSGNPLHLERETLSQDQDGNETRVYLFRNEIWYGNVGEKGQGKKRNSNTMWISRRMYIRVNNRMWRMWRIVNHRVSACLQKVNFQLSTQIDLISVP